MNVFAWIGNCFRLLVFIFKFIRPIYKDLKRIISEVNELGLSNEAARKTVFQDMTDFIQKNGMHKIPDSVLNCAIELSYQIYLWEKEGEKKS